MPQHSFLLKADDETKDVCQEFIFESDFCLNMSSEVVGTVKQGRRTSWSEGMSLG